MSQQGAAGAEDASQVLAAAAGGLESLALGGSAGGERAPGPGARSGASTDAGSTITWARGPSSTSPESLDPSPEPDVHEPDWEEIAGSQRYEPLHFAGPGACGCGAVLVAWDREGGEKVALQRVRFGLGRSDGVPAHVVREVSLLREFEHRNIVQIKDLLMGADECQLVFEYVPGDLYQVLRGHQLKGTQLPIEKVVQYSQDLLEGMHACHQHRIIQRDLNPQNVLIHPVDGLKICDFGLARIASVQAWNCTEGVTSLWYRGPELLLGHPRNPKYGPAVDIWSSGCIVVEMATGCPCFPGDCGIGTMFKIMQMLGSPTETAWPGFQETLTQWRPSFPKWPPTDLRAIRDKRPELGDAGMDLVAQLLAMSPAARPSARRARAHAFLARPAPA